MTNPFADADIIFSYSRAQAIEDGVLVSIDAETIGEDMARQAGFKIPMAMTTTVWGQYVEVPEAVEGFQDIKGRLWDILWMASLAARQNRSTSELLFKVLVANDRRGPREVTLKLHCGPGDQAEPVLTIMLPDED
jgi:hypothetical protein